MTRKVDGVSVEANPFQGRREKNTKRGVPDKGRPLALQFLKIIAHEKSWGSGFFLLMFLLLFEVGTQLLDNCLRDMIATHFELCHAAGTY